MKEDHNYWPIPIEAESNEIFEKYENDDKCLISKESKTDENGIEYYEIFRKASLTFYLPDDILIQYFNTEIEAELYCRTHVGFSENKEYEMHYDIIEE